MNPVKIIGMGLGPEDLTERHIRMIAEADVLVGGRRHLWNYSDHPSEKMVIGKDVKTLARQVARHAETKHVVVLASGDPLFYGIGKAFAAILGKENVEIFPNVTAVAGAFSRIKESWDDVAVLSFHGKTPDDDGIDRILGHDKVAVLTDPVNSPSELAKQLWGKGVERCRMCVLENMGSDREKVGWYDLEEAAGRTFSDPNLVILKKDPEIKEGPEEPKALPIGLGMADDLFAHQNGLITKAEIRVVSLSKLCLEDHHVMWDLGAGSGAVSIEAAGFIRKGRIFALEQHEERVADIKENMARFAVTNMVPVTACLPGGMDNLPDPDRIFVGGGGRDLEAILTAACTRLVQGGMVVVNTVLIGNVHTAMTTLEALGYRTDVVQVQVNTGYAMPWNLMLKAGNPVFIIRGIKP